LREVILRKISIFVRLFGFFVMQRISGIYCAWLLPLYSQRSFVALPMHLLRAKIKYKPFHPYICPLSMLIFTMGLLKMKQA
jgi:hypothetical protein